MLNDPFCSERGSDADAAGDLHSHVIHGSLAHASLFQNGISIGSAIFAQLNVECPITLQWAATFPPIAPSPWGSGPHLTHGA